MQAPDEQHKKMTNQFNNINNNSNADNNVPLGLAQQEPGTQWVLETLRPNPSTNYHRLRPWYGYLNKHIYIYIYINLSKIIKNHQLYSNQIQNI